MTQHERRKAVCTVCNILHVPDKKVIEIRAAVHHGHIQYIGLKNEAKQYLMPSCLHTRSGKTTLS